MVLAGQGAAPRSGPRPVRRRAGRARASEACTMRLEYRSHPVSSLLVGAVRFTLEPSPLLAMGGRWADVSRVTSVLLREHWRVTTLRGSSSINFGALRDAGVGRRTEHRLLRREAFAVSGGETLGITLPQRLRWSALHHRESGGTADAPDLGSGARKGVGVRLSPLARSRKGDADVGAHQASPYPAMRTATGVGSPSPRASSVAQASGTGNTRSAHGNTIAKSGSGMSRTPSSCVTIASSPSTSSPARSPPASAVSKPTLSVVIVTAASAS